MTIRRASALAAAAAAALAAPSAPAGAQAAETSTYRYDALGRLVRVEQSAAGATASGEYSYDPAGNRTALARSGALPPPPPLRRGFFLLINRNGYQIVPIN